MQNTSSTIRTQVSANVCLPRGHSHLLYIILGNINTGWYLCNLETVSTSLPSSCLQSLAIFGGLRRKEKRGSDWLDPVGEQENRECKLFCHFILLTLTLKLLKQEWWQKFVCHFLDPTQGFVCPETKTHLLKKRGGGTRKVQPESDGSEALLTWCFRPSLSGCIEDVSQKKRVIVVT